jgi:hypothetical protein
MLLFLVEVALRFVPVNYVAYRGWEAARSSGGGGFFLPNQRYENDRSYGDLANLGNLPARREYRRDTFTTDGRGYRNPPDLLSGARPAAVLLGDSFAAGAGNPDDAMLSSELTRRIGAPVYNAAARNVWELDEWLGVSREIGLDRGWVIYEHLQGASGPPPTRSKKPPWVRWRPLSVSPMKIWMSRGLRRIQDGVVLPNPHLRRVDDLRLSDGTPMLFLPDPGALTPRQAEEDADRWKDLLARRSEELSRSGLRLLVVLVPTKRQIYGPMLEPPSRSLDAAFDSFARLEEGLRGRAVAVVNLAPVFRREAEARVARGELLYWRDDTHWNPAGIRLAAEEIAKALR